MRLKSFIRSRKLEIPKFEHTYPSLLEASYDELKIIAGDLPMREPPAIELEYIYHELLQAHKAGTPFDQVSSNVLRHAPYVIFTYPRDAYERLADEHDFYHRYTLWLMQKARAVAIRTMLKVFIKEYPVNRYFFEKWRKALKIILEQRTDPGLAIWKERVNRFYLLDEDGPLRFGALLHRESKPLDELLEVAGLKNELAVQGFLPRAFESCLAEHERIAEGNQGFDSFRRIVELSKYRNPQTGQMGLRFWELRSRLAKALILPFESSDPPEEYKNEIQSFLNKNLRDPRFPNHFWPESAQDARAIMLRWLAKQTLRDFFRILKETADDIWKYREEFWGAYLDAGYILEAWAILGSNARQMARKVFKEKRIFGELKGASSKQSVLLMRIGNLIIAEWSHSGKCRIWNIDDPTYSDTQPPLNIQNRPYHASELRTACNAEESHFSSANWLWQSHVAQHIKRMANIKYPNRKG